MGQANLPLANAAKHAKAFVRLGSLEDRRGRGKHLVLTKDGHRATLSIPDHREVKRALIAGLLAAAEISESDYLDAFRK